MKYLLALLLTSAIMAGCSSSKDNQTEKTAAHIDRFAAQFKDITEIADLRQLTNLKKDIQPFFSPAGDRVYFSRLLIESPDDPAAMFSESNQTHFSLDFRNNKLYMLQAAPVPPKQNVISKENLPEMVIENPLYGIRYDSVLFFNTEGGTGGANWTIYKLVNDSLSQITYGSEGSLLNVISPDGKYMAFTYGNDSLRLAVMNLRTDRFYIVPRSEVESDRFDFRPQFSPDSKYMVFLRSGELYDKNLDPFGDIWLVEFKDSSSTAN